MRGPDVGKSAPQADVVIVGGGVAGLACARRLALSRRGIRILLVEGRTRLGGRSLTVDDGVDLGGQWIGPNQPYVLDLVQHLGLGSSVVRQTWFDEDGSGLTSGASVLSQAEEASFEQLVAKVNERASKVRGPPLDDAWTFDGSAERATELDGISAADFLDRHPICVAMGFFTDEGTQPLSTRVRREFALLIQTVLACEPRQLSFLWFLFFVRACGGLAEVGDGDGGAQTFKLKGGTMQLAERCAAEMEAELGVTVLRGTDVTAITASSAGGPDAMPIALHAEGGCVCTTRALVVAFSPMLWRRVRWHRSVMPAAKAALAAKLVGGRAIKVVAIYDSAFWEQSTARAPCDRPAIEDCGPVANLFPSVGRHPALVGLITAEDATEFGALPSDAARRAVVLEQFETHFGTRAAASPRAVHLKDWQTETLSGGCFAALLPPRAATSAASERPRVTLESPVELHGCGGGLVAFASTELAASWPGYFEGALDAGYRAAGKVGAWMDAQRRDGPHAARSRL